MNYEAVKYIPSEQFKRLTGIRPETFEIMLDVWAQHIWDFDRPRKLTRADHLLVTLLYWRDYRTAFHLGVEFGVSEATVCWIIWIVRKK